MPCRLTRAPLRHSDTSAVPGKSCQHQQREPERRLGWAQVPITFIAMSMIGSNGGTVAGAVHNRCSNPQPRLGLHCIASQAAALIDAHVKAGGVTAAHVGWEANSTSEQDCLKLVAARTVVADVERVRRAGGRRDVGEVRLGADLGRRVHGWRQRAGHLHVAEADLSRERSSMAQSQCQDETARD